MVLWELDFVTGRLSYDHAAMPRLGLGEADRPGTLEDWVARVHPDDCPGFLDRVHRATRPGGDPFDCEYPQWHRKPGRGRALARSIGQPTRCGG